MENKKIYILGTLLILILSTVVYVTYSDTVKFRVDNDKSTLYLLNEDTSRWNVAGREFNNLFDGATKMNRRSSKINVETFVNEVDLTTTIVRTTTYIRGPVIKDTYLFDGNLDNIELVPVSHTVEIFNGSGYFYRYEVRDLQPILNYGVLEGTSFQQGRVKVEWQDDYRWAKNYKSGIIKVQYNILSDYEVFNVRLYDPIIELNLTNYIVSLQSLNMNHTIFWNTSQDFNIFNVSCKFANSTWHGCMQYNNTVITEHSKLVIDKSWQRLWVNSNYSDINKSFNCWTTPEKVWCESNLDGDGKSPSTSGESYCYLDYNQSLIFYSIDHLASQCSGELRRAIV